MSIKFKKIKKKNLSRIKPLWQQLNCMHINDSKHFKEYFQEFKFEKRIEKWMKLKNKNLFIQIIEKNNQILGYCVSTYQKKVGEIDSIFIIEEYRNLKIGEQLITNALKWFEKKECQRITVSIADGHDSVIPFYEKFNFYHRKTVLELKN